jgi:hypothetical protein
LRNDHWAFPQSAIDIDRKARPDRHGGYAGHPTIGCRCYERSDTCVVLVVSREHWEARDTEGLQDAFAGKTTCFRRLLQKGPLSGEYRPDVSRIDLRDATRERGRANGNAFALECVEQVNGRADETGKRLVCTGAFIRVFPTAAD